MSVPLLARDDYENTTRGQMQKYKGINISYICHGHDGNKTNINEVALFFLTMQTSYDKINNIYVLTLITEDSGIGHFTGRSSSGGSIGCSTGQKSVLLSATP